MAVNPVFCNLASLLALHCLLLLTFTCAQEQCITSSFTQHGKTITSCDCRGDLTAETVNEFIRSNKCSLITLANCTIDKMIEQVEDTNSDVMLTEVHFRLENCLVDNWQVEYMTDPVSEDEYMNEPTSSLVPIKFLVFKNVSLANYDSWTEWTKTFEVDGKLQEMLRFDNSVQLVLHAGKLFSDRITTNYEFAIAYANMDLNDGTLFQSVSRMLGTFNVAPDELDEGKALFLHALLFENTQLQTVPTLRVSVQGWQTQQSTLSFRGNLIRQIGAKSFATYKVAKLTVLNLSQNLISSLDPAAFNSFTALRELDLSGNQLTAIDLATFNRLSNLLYVNLKYNKLSQLADWSSLPLYANALNVNSSVSRGFDLYSNPWDCSCALNPTVNAYRKLTNSSTVNSNLLVPVCTNGQNFLELRQTAGLCTVPLLGASNLVVTTTTTIATTTTVAKTSSTARATSTTGAKTTTVAARTTTAAAARASKTSASTSKTPASTSSAGKQTSAVDTSNEKAVDNVDVLPAAAAGSFEEPSKVQSGESNAGQQGMSSTIIIIVIVVAVLSVIAGIVITVLVLRSKKRKQKTKENGNNSKDTNLPLMMSGNADLATKDKYAVQTNGNGAYESKPMV